VEFSDIEEVNIKYCSNASEALDYIKNNRVDIVISDANIPKDSSDRNYDALLYDSENLFSILQTAQDKTGSEGYRFKPVVFSVLFEDELEDALKEKFDSIVIFKLSTVSKEANAWARIIKDAYHQLVEDYEAVLKKQHINPAQESAKTGSQTIFVIENSPSEAGDLSKFIKAKLGDAYDVVKIDSEWGLKRALNKQKPDLVITDTTLDDISEKADILQIDYILGLVKNKNPEVKFIITSDVAALMPLDRFKSEGFDVLGIVEKPFYFNDVLNIIQPWERPSLKGLLNSLEASLRASL
jgi:DNA-binding NtrC family response regulator